MPRIPRHKLESYLRRPDGELDLHGLRVTEAIVELERFLETAQRLGWKRLRVITGRGLNSPEGKGVLNQAIREYLIGQGYGFSRAASRDGGDGALEIRL